MQFSVSFFLPFLVDKIANFCSQYEGHPITTDTNSSLHLSSSSNSSWAYISAHHAFALSNFGGTTYPTGSGVIYKGNFGNPYGSNITEVTSRDVSLYKYVVRFEGCGVNPWTIVIWNKYSSSGVMGGWYGKACKVLSLAAGEVKYLAFDNDSPGGWAAARGSTIPMDSNGGYDSTWGEFDFGSAINSGWSGFDVSAIAAQEAGFEVQGMRICDVLSQSCSYVTPNCSLVSNAYTVSDAKIGGIGGNIPAGPVRLSVILGYGSGDC